MYNRSNEIWAYFSGSKRAWFKRDSFLSHPTSFKCLQTTFHMDELHFVLITKPPISRSLNLHQNLIIFLNKSSENFPFFTERFMCTQIVVMYYIDAAIIQFSNMHHISGALCSKECIKVISCKIVSRNIPQFALKVL